MRRFPSLEKWKCERFILESFQLQKFDSELWGARQVWRQVRNLKQYQDAL